jgi:hypothetical protein
VKKKKLRVLALFDVGSPTALDEDLRAELKTADWKVENDVLGALKKLGHETDYLAIFDDLDLLRQKLDSYQPDLVFNLADQFRNNRALDQNIVSFLELRGCAFTAAARPGSRSARTRRSRRRFSATTASGSRSSWSSRAGDVRHGPRGSRSRCS